MLYVAIKMKKKVAEEEVVCLTEAEEDPNNNCNKLSR